MKFGKIENEQGGFLLTSELEDFEYCDPIEMLKKDAFEHHKFVTKNLFQNRNFQNNFLLEETILNLAEESSVELLNFFKSTDVPQQLISLLSTSKKKQQVSLLKNLSFTAIQFIAFTIKAGEQNYLLSQYSAEFDALGIEARKFPKAFFIKNNQVKVYGKTTLTQGQLKNAIECSKTTIAKFLDKGAEWHCFFLTYESLRGKESWNGNQPHMHYISDKFGLPREKVVSELKSRRYNLNNLPHIALLDMGNQPK
jgi:hypothetical protein